MYSWPLHLTSGDGTKTVYVWFKDAAGNVSANDLDTIVLDTLTSIPTNGLIAEYLFNGNANDTSGQGNDGIVNGSTLTTDRNGNANSAYIFDGVDDYIEIADHSSLDGMDGLTISVWVNVVHVIKNNS